MNILLVEDETRVAEFISRGLQAEGWKVEHDTDGESALERLKSAEFDVIILDVMLPNINGLETCQKLRARGCFTPVLMLSALDATDERVAGLRHGADDYLPKPFEFDELLARLEALHRREKRFESSSDSSNSIGIAGVTLDTSALEVRVDDQIVELTIKEREILTYLLQNKDRVVARERILNAVWGTQADPLTNVVDVYVARLRKKLDPYGKLIVTVRGVGYRLIEP